MQRFSWRLLNGEVTAAVSGSAPQRFFSLLLKNRIRLSAVEETQGEYRFCHDAGEQCRIRRFAEKTGMRYRVLTVRGLPAAGKRIVRRPGLWIAALLLLLLFFGLSMFIWHIEITGNTTLGRTEILRRLEEQDLHIGRWKGGIDTEAVTQTLLRLYPDLSFVSISVRGSVLEVRVTQRTETPDLPYRDETTGSLVATGDFVVYSIVAEQGTPRVKKGDVVHKGDVLISGYIASTADDGSVSLREGLARGTVLGLTRRTFTEEVDRRTERREYAEKPMNALAFFYRDRQIYLWKPFRIGENYDIITTRLWSAGGSGGSLFSVYHEEYFGYRRYEYEYTDEEMEKLLQERLTRSLEQWLSDGRRYVIDRGYESEATADGRKAVLSVRAIEDIAERSSLEDAPQEEETE